jgi:hypothetical protein
MEPTLESTLYPKITNHVHEVIKTLKRQKRDRKHSDGSVHLEPIPIIGTVKLHGTHADIIIGNDNTITLQSRNKVNLLPTADNYEFAATMSKKTESLLRLRDRLIARWKNLNPTTTLDTTTSITIAGEWIGTKIMRDVAISNLSRRLVIISTKINGLWVPDSDYSSIEVPEDNIYNISRGGIYHSMLYPEEPQKTISELEQLAENVAAQCPFAKSFGVIGEGEGLVWKLIPYISDPALWFKTKGGKFKPTFTPVPKKMPPDAATTWENVVELAKAWCGEQRLEQGWDYLREMGIERNMKGIGQFLKWVQQDILKEEKGYIKEHSIDDGFLRQAIIGIAKPWYLANVAQRAGQR